MELNLTNTHRKRLLEIARNVVLAEVTGKLGSAVDAVSDPVLNQPCGCFVTLHVAGQLRGCIGTFVGQNPLHETVVEMARAALQDPRFLDKPMQPSELDKLDIEISVLSQLKRTDDPLSLELGKHGIYIKKDYRSGCFLPQVATETGWTKEQFLSYCCSHKANLPAAAWKDKDCEVYLFTADVFSEQQLNGTDD